MQKDLLSNLLKRNPRAVFIASLGTICYDLEKVIQELNWKGEAYFIRGAMGCATSIALGYALNSKKKIICVIGDGAAMMKLGSFITVEHYKPKNLEIHVIQNEKYASTGGQRIYPGNILPNVVASINGRTHSLS